jgi:hypothetical protein
MHALVSNDVFARLPPEVQDAVLICAVAIARLEEADQRVAIAYLMAAIKLG